MRPISSRLPHFAALLICLMWSVAAQAQYTFTTFVAPGAAGMQGWGINSALKVPANIASSGGPFQGYVYDFSSNSFTALPSAGGGITVSAIGINDAGQLTGSYTDGSFAKGFVLTGGIYDTFSYHQVTAQSGKKLTAARATQIINSATAIRASMGC